MEIPVETIVVSACLVGRNMFFVSMFSEAEAPAMRPVSTSDKAGAVSDCQAIMMAGMRAFIAVDVSATSQLAAVQKHLSQLGPPIRPVASDNLHVTIRFLGNTACELLPDIRRVLEEVTARLPITQARLAGLGAFPALRRPSVVWIGLDGVDPLITAAEELNRRLAPLGFRHESRPFHPHLTVARIHCRRDGSRDVIPERLFKLLRQHAQTGFETQVIDAIHLYQSQLHQDGAQYTRLHTVRCGAAVSG